MKESKVIEKLRILISRIFVLFLMMIILVSESYWEDDLSTVSNILFLIGVIMAAVGSLGRLWCSLYIAGYKTKKLITEGPYSMCRNPLYFFSLIGAVGVGFATETFLFPLVILPAFALYYPLVIRSEEAELKKLHQKEFEIYVRQTPVFFPKLSLLREPEEYTVKPKVFRKHMFDALWFIWLTGILELIESLHEVNILPSIFRIY